MSKNVVITAALALAIGAGGGYWAAQNLSMLQGPVSTESEAKKPLYYRNPMNPAITSPVFTQDSMGMDYIPVYAEDNKPKEKKIVFYRNPMNPAITSPVAAKDEMGMDYIPVYEDGGSGSNEPAGTVTIDPVVVQNIGVRTAIAKTQAISRSINALGQVDFDEERLARLHPKTNGWIGKLKVNETGTRVKKDSILLSIYSPDLVAAQREYLVALKNWEAVSARGGKTLQSTENLVNSALERLELFDVPRHQINELKKSRSIQKYLHIHSPFKGTIMNIGAREGQYVTPKDELYLIADLKKIWVYVDVYEDDLPWVKLGDKVEMRVRVAPGRVFRGGVSFIYPYLEGNTRTVRVRLVFDNRDLVLKPGMFANILIKTDTQPNATVVPSEAIVRSGSREQVFVQRDVGKYEPRDVILGLSAAGMTQIREGIKPGEQVVTSAVFLIDSESKLREATAKMMEALKTDVAPDLSMDNMQMDDMDMEMNDLSMDDMDMKSTKSDSTKKAQ